MQQPGGSRHEATTGSRFETLAAERSAAILSCLDASWWWRLWRPRQSDPELRKLLGRIYRGIGDALRIDRSTHKGLGDEGRERFCQILEVDPTTLNVDTALDVVDALDRALIELGDERYLRDLFAVELARDRTDTSATTLSHVFSSPPQKEEVALVDSGKPLDEAALESIRNQLSGLYLTRSVLYDLHRARQGMKSRYMLALVPALAILVAGFAVISYDIEPNLPATALVIVAGALGALLSGTLRLRDHISNINDLRAFRPLLAVQPLIGATAGLVSLLVLESKVVQVNWGGPAWATEGVVAFAAGFSEPFFLGIVGRVASIGDAKANAASH
jgi:hypothetical protein